MNRKVITGILLTLLFTSILTLAFGIQLNALDKLSSAYYSSLVSSEPLAMKWNKTYSGGSEYLVQQTSNEGYLVAGYSAGDVGLKKLGPEPRTWTVDDDGPADFHTIQEAINAASPGDIIKVYGGRYYEHVVVNKTLELEGEIGGVSVYAAFVDGNRTPGTVVTIRADNVVVERFTIVNSGSQPEDAGICVDNSHGAIVQWTTLINNSIGISLVDSDENTLESNDIDYGEACSIDLRNSHNNVIKYNHMRKHGIRVMESNSNTFYRNGVVEAEYGISLKGNHNNLTRNYCERNGIGINLQGNHSNIVRNQIISNLQYGIMLSGRDNLIYHNNFVNNTKQVWTDSVNSWDDGYPSGGNFWSDHPGVDWYSGPNQDVLGSDGIGDTPYVIDKHDRDRYPLMMWPPPLIILSVYPPIDTVALGETFDVNITVTGIFISETIPISNGLFGWDAWMTFDPNVVHAVNATQRSFLSEWASTYGYTTVFRKRINNTDGFVRVGETVYPKMPPDDTLPPVGATGDGILTTITFEVKAQGTTQIHFETPERITKTGLYTIVAKNLIDLIKKEDVPVFIVDGLVTVLGSPVIPAEVDIVPNTLNLRSKGKWITAHVKLPEGYDASNVSVSTVMLNDTIPISLLDIPAPRPFPTEIGDYEGDAVRDLIVKFDRTMVKDLILSEGITYGNVTLTITGIVAGTPFEGSDSIRVIL